MSKLDDHCIITKYEITEREKELKKAFFKGGKVKNSKPDTIKHQETKIGKTIKLN